MSGRTTTPPNSTPGDLRMVQAREVLAKALERNEQHASAASIRAYSIDSWMVPTHVAIDAILTIEAAARESAAKVAESDVDWTGFAKNRLEQWGDGPDDLRDYRLGIAAGRVIATAIREASQ